jgi:hypothetical protein
MADSVYDIMMKIGITETVLGTLGQIGSFLGGLQTEANKAQAAIGGLVSSFRGFASIYCGGENCGRPQGRRRGRKAFEDCRTMAGNGRYSRTTRARPTQSIRVHSDNRACASQGGGRRAASRRSAKQRRHSKTVRYIYQTLWLGADLLQQAGADELIDCILRHDKQARCYREDVLQAAPEQPRRSRMHERDIADP